VLNHLTGLYREGKIVDPLAGQVEECRVTG
jgi:hypothetical protein